MKLVILLYYSAQWWPRGLNQCQYYYKNDMDIKNGEVANHTISYEFKVFKESNGFYHRTSNDSGLGE